MFIDRARSYIKAGKGGDGMIAFHREKFIEKGGPSGGDGGRGGSIYFVADSGLTTLIDFKYRKKIIADDGEKGHGKKMYGKYADDIVIKVPVGTVVYEEGTDRIVADFTKHGQKELIAKGGRGGRGNAKFATSVNQVPRIAENGEPGEEFNARIELKLLADVGLVGFPSVGKSTLLSVVSSARPEIADYHFTTLSPNLGVVEVGNGNSFVMADLPGLIEGAHTGKGLGLEFLRHIERCKVLIHVIDMAMVDGRSPMEDFKIINNELKQYGPKLLERPMIIAANKMDDEGAWLILDEFKKEYPDYEIYPISALTRTGIKELIYRADELVKSAPELSLIDESKLNSEKVVYEYKEDDPGFKITHPEQNLWVISGDRVEKLFKMTNISDDQGLMYLLQTMRKMGVDDELARLGVKNGDTVRLCNFEFDYFE